MPSFEKEVTRPLPYPEQGTTIPPRPEAAGFPGPPSVIACRFSGAEAAELAYRALLECLRPRADRAASIYLLPKFSQVAIVYASLDNALQRAIDLHLPASGRFRLPPWQEKQLVARRAREIAPVGYPSASAPGYGVPFEGVVVGALGDGKPGATPNRMGPLQAAITQVQRSERMLSHIPPISPGTALRMQTIPFIKAYSALHRAAQERHYQALAVRNLQVQSGPRPGFLDPLRKQITDLLHLVDSEVLRSATKYRFTESAMAMHRAVFEDGDTTWVDPGNHAWIELDIPTDTPYGEQVKALYLHFGYPVPEIERVIRGKCDQQTREQVHDALRQHQVNFILDVIDARCALARDFVFDFLSKRWVFLSTHICPYKECAFEAGTCLPCARCRAACRYWAAWLRTALLMVQGEYAVSPDPEPFAVERVVYQEEARVTVGKGKNKRSIRQQVSRTIDYVSVTYEISVSTARPAAAKAGGEEASGVEGEKRVSWLRLHGREDRIYRRKRMPVLERRYSGPRFRHIIQRCLKGETVHRDGWTYQIEREASGEVVVVGRVQYPRGRYVPYLRPELRRSQTVHRVVASRYAEAQPTTGQGR